MINTTVENLQEALAKQCIISERYRNKNQKLHTELDECKRYKVMYHHNLQIKNKELNLSKQKIEKLEEEMGYFRDLEKEIPNIKKVIEYLKNSNIQESNYSFTA